MCSHVPNKGEQMVRYYGYYSNAARGKRKKAAVDDQVPCILEPELGNKAFRQKQMITSGILITLPKPIFKRPSRLYR